MGAKKRGGSPKEGDAKSARTDMSMQEVVDELKLHNDRANDMLARRMDKSLAVMSDSVDKLAEAVRDNKVKLDEFREEYKAEKIEMENKWAARRQAMEEKMAAFGVAAHNTAGHGVARRSRSVPAPASRAGAPNLDLKAACSVEVSGLPPGTPGGEIADFIKENIDHKTPPYKDVCSLGRRASKGIVLFASPDDRARFLNSLRRPEFKDERPEYKDEDGDAHRIYWNPKLSSEEGKRQMIQPRIRKVLAEVADEDGNIKHKILDIDIVRGRGEVYMKCHLVAKVAWDGLTWEICYGVCRAGYDKKATEDAVRAALPEM